MYTQTHTQTVTVPAPLQRPSKERHVDDDAGAFQFKTPVVWKNAVGFLLLHLAGVYGLYQALFCAKLLTVLWAIVVAVVSGLGVTIGAHRLFTHRCFKATWGLRLFLVTMHTIAGQNCLYIWVRDHRQHHKYSDTDADPHNSNRGFFFSHVGWLMMRKHPDVLRYGSTVDLSDLEADPIIMFQKRYYKTLYTIFALFLPIAVAHFGWHEDWFVGLGVCFFMRTVIILNITWLVNSAAHMYGMRPYNKNIEPVESELVSFLSFGEGWHNYHHTFPWDYRAAELGMKWDVSTRIIDWMARKGWVYDLKEAPKTCILKRVLHYGDGTHPSCQAQETSKHNARDYVATLPPKENNTISIH